MRKLSTRLSPALLLLLALTTAPPSPAQDAGNPRGVRVQGRAATRDWPDRPKRYALIIGVDEYEDGQMSRLNGAGNDAGALAEALVAHAGFPPDQVVLLTSSQPAGLQPKRGTILRYLSNLRGAVPKDGLLLIAFSGHGIERGGKAFLLPADAQSSNDVRLLEETAIEVGRLRELVAETGVGQVVLLLDACRNDPAPGRAGGDNPMTKGFAESFDFGRRNRDIVAFATLYATAVGQRAYEYRAKKQGYFTWALVEGLKGAAADERGVVTLAGLTKYVQDKVPKYVQRDLGAENRQQPYSLIEGYMAEELVIAAAPRPAAAAEARPAKEDEEAAFWKSIRASKNARDYEEYLRRYPEGDFAEVAQVRLSSLRPAAAAAAPTPAPTSPAPEFDPYKKPIPRNGLINAIKINGLTADELLSQIRRRGVDFEMTAENEAELRAVGARPEIIEAARSSYRPAGAAPALPPGAGREDYDTLLSRARSAAAARDYADALGYAQRAARLDPQQPGAYTVLGQVALYHTKDFAAAEQAMRSAIERGGSASFRVRHNHDGDFKAYCEGTLSVGAAGLSFIAADTRDTFTVNDSDIGELKLNTFVGSQAGAFQLKSAQKINGRNSFTFAPDSLNKAESELIIRLIRAY